MDQLKQNIKAEASRLGFSFIGFSLSKQTPHFNSYKAWSKTLPSGLQYLQLPYVQSGRENPQSLLHNSKTVITAGISYPTGMLYEQAKNECSGILAAYARLPDYHLVLREKLRKLAGIIKYLYGWNYKFRIFIDSGPVMEKDFAFSCGLGWIGKNSLLLTPHFGSCVLLGCLIIEEEIEPDLNFAYDLCISCSKCIKACPTGAIKNDRTLDASRCIAYLTTSHKTTISCELMTRMGNAIFGCDICQRVCPKNRQFIDMNIVSGAYSDADILPFELSLENELALDEKGYLDKYSKFPIKKLSYPLFLRNLAIVAGNSNCKDFKEQLGKQVLKTDHPAFLHAATWALERLS